MPGAKGDAVLPEFLIESKATIKQSISVKKSWLEKIEREALETNRAPILTLSFVQPNGDAIRADYLVIPRWVAEKVGML